MTIGQLAGVSCDAGIRNEFFFQVSSCPIRQIREMEGEKKKQKNYYGLYSHFGRQVKAEGINGWIRYW